MNRFEIKNTPFCVYEDEKLGISVICLGNQRVSKREFKSVKAAESYVNSKPWELIINTLFAINEMVKQSEKEVKND